MPSLLASIGSGRDSDVLVTAEGFVLAGGESRRFGQDKALYSFDGSTLVERAVETLRRAGCDRVVVLHRRPTDLEFLDCEVTCDVGGGQGPLDGLHTALLLARTDYIVTLPVDQILVTSEVFRQLLDIVRRSEETDVVPIVDERGSSHHLTAAWRVKTCLPIVDQHIGRGISSPRQVLEFLACRWQTCSADLMINANRIEDLPRGRPTLRSISHPVDGKS